MAGTIDYQGIAEVIAALGVAIPSIVSAVNSVISNRRSARNEAKLNIIQTHVDGMNQMIAKGSHAEGVIEGGDAERANPTQPK